VCTERDAGQDPRHGEGDNLITILKHTHSPVGSFIFHWCWYSFMFTALVGRDLFLLKFKLSVSAENIHIL